MALPPRSSSPIPQLRSTKGPTPAPAPAPRPAISPPPPSSSSFGPPTASFSRVNSLTADSATRREHPAPSLVHDPLVSARQPQHETPPKSQLLPPVACTMGLLKGVKSAVRRVGGKRVKEPNREHNDKKPSGALWPSHDGDGLADEDMIPPEPEPPDRPALHLQPYVESIADSFEAETQTKPEPQMRSEQPMKQSFGYSPKELQNKKPPLSQLQKQVQPDLVAQSSHGPAECGLDSESDLETDEGDVSEVELDRSPDLRPVYRKGLGRQHIHYSTSQGGRLAEHYRFPFQSGRGSEDQQSFYSGVDKAPSLKASSYRGHGRVDSHASPIVEDHRYSHSIRAEVVRERRVPRDELRKPTLRLQREPPPPEQLQYHGFGELGRADDQGSLFQTSRRKLSDEPVSPTSRPQPKDIPKSSTCKQLTAESITDFDSESDSSQQSAVSDAESNESNASSDAESEISEPMLTVPRHAQRHTRTVSMPAVQSHRPRPKRTGSLDTVRLAEWMRGGPPSSFYPHPEEPADLACLDRHVACYPFYSGSRPTSLQSSYQWYPPAKRPPNSRDIIRYSTFASREGLEKRIAEAKGKHQNENLKESRDQLDEERHCQQREKDILARRIADLEYEKRRLGMENGEISLKNGELTKRVANISMRFMEQRRKVADLEMRQRGWEDLEAQLKNTPHGLLTPPDTASSRSTPGNPERVRAWAETLADPALPITETLAAPENSQKQEAVHEDDGRVRAFDETAVDAPHELQDPIITNPSSGFFSISQSQLYGDLQPEILVESTQPQTFPSTLKMPGTRLHELTPITPIYSQSIGSAATFGSDQQPSHRPEPGLSDEHIYCHRVLQPNTTSRQTPQSSLRYHNRRLRQQPKQVQFDGYLTEKVQDTKHTKDAAPLQSRDVVERLVKQQQRPVGRQVAPAGKSLVQQISHLSGIENQQLPQPLMASQPHVTAMNHQGRPQSQHLEFNITNHQAHQSQQPSTCESQMISMQQRRLGAPRQHSAPANIQPIQQHRSPLRHAHSSSPLQPTVQLSASRRLSTHGSNRPHPSNLHMPSQHTIYPPRPCTSLGASRPTINLPRPSTSHGRSQHTMRNPYPPRPGTSHSTHCATFGSSTVAAPQAFLPTIPQSLQHTQLHQHRSRGCFIVPTTGCHYETPQSGGTSARSHDTAASHRTVLGRMQGKARAGLAENERANAERSAAEASAQRQRIAAAATAAAACNSSRIDYDRLMKLDEQQVTWGRALVGEGRIQAREQADKAWREQEQLMEKGKGGIQYNQDREIKVEVEVMERGDMNGVFT